MSEQNEGHDTPADRAAVRRATWWARKGRRADLDEILDPIDLLREFIAEGVHARPRMTKDLDLFVSRDAENAARVFRALAKFGAG